MSKCKIMSNLYFRITYFPPFKDFHGLHMNWNRSPINRSLYRITDLDLWFNSDFDEGGELVVRRVSENGRYDFQKHMKIFD